MYRLCLVLIAAFGCAMSSPAELPAALRNIIPTPQQIEAAGGFFELVRDGAPVAALVTPDDPPAKVALAAEHLSRRVQELSGVTLPVVTEGQQPEGPALWFGGAGLRHVEPEWNNDLDPAQRSQEYLIAPVDDGRGYALVGREPLGTLYAGMTVLAALDVGESSVRLPNLRCHDWPDIPYRWLSGFPGFESVEELIDWCMEHKINVIRSPGFYRRTMTEAETQREQNRYARAHGVRTLNLLYGDLGLKNRRSYPDGETYVCLDEKAPSARGFCVSNEALLAEKQRLLHEFVQATEPGVLYIHFVDEDDIEDATEIWLNRCDDCRRAYPNDRVDAEDGKAGAQAMVFDAMCDAIASVSVPESGYDASRDCLIIFVSAPYTVWSEDDAAWEREVAYHCTVSRLMRRVENVHFCIRENGLRRDNHEKRCRELSRALATRGNGHRMMMYFRGGDTRDTTIGWPRRINVPWRMLATPAMAVSFEGAGSILMAGSAPGLLEVEYSWNLHGDGFFHDPSTQEEWRETYLGLARGTLRPPEIFGDDGFLGRMLAHLYGAGAARDLGVLYRPRAMEEAGGAVLVPVGWTRWLSMARDPWFGSITPERQRQFQTLFGEWHTLNREAAEAVEAALAAADLRERHQGDLETTHRALQAAGRLQAAAAHASAAYALLLEGDEDAAGAEMEAAGGLCVEAGQFAEGLAEHARAIAAEQRAMTEHYQALVLRAEQIRQAEQRLDEARASAEDDREALRRELSGASAADPSRLDGKTVALVGGGRGGEIAALLEPHGARVLPLPALPDLPDEALAADVILLATRTLSSAGQTRLQEYIEGGGAVLLESAGPFYMVGRDVDLSRIALWLGAERYGNHGGGVVPAGETALTRSIEPDESLQARRSAACLYRPLGALPILAAEGHAERIMAMVHRFGQGRVGYVWTLTISGELAAARSQVVLRMIAWLAGP